MRYRLLIFVGVVLGANLQILDTTMATVALPHMQGALSATQDEIAWVLTSYLIAVAIFMPLVGTLSERLGRRRLFLGTIVGFCIASMFAGAADSLFEIVVYRFLQGVFASPLVPISQSFVFDTFPPEKRGKAMGWWVLGMMVGAMSGPALGGYLTEFHSWRWAFYINVPFGIVAFAIIYIFGPTRRLPRGTQPFGMAGFLILSVGLVSPQIVSAALLAAASLYVYTVHTAYSSRPFIPRAVFADRNFSIGIVLMVMLGIHWLAFLALISPYLQTLAGYPVLLAGLVLVPQALGAAVGAFTVGQLLSRFHPVPLMILGIIALAWANWQMSLFTPGFDRTTFYVIVFVHGLGFGFYFVPLSVITFSTLPRQYTDVGTGLYTLARIFGSSVGVSLTVAYVVRETQANHAVLGEYASPFNEALRHLPLPEAWNFAETTGVAALNAEATRQAAAIAYNGDFGWLAMAGIVCIPLLMFVRMPSGNRIKNEP